MSEDLIRLAQNGDMAAEETLLYQYLPLVKSIAARFFLNGGDTEDLVQKGLMALYKAIKLYKFGGAAFSSYAYSLVHNAIVDMVKSSNSEKHRTLNSSIPIEIVKEPSNFDMEDEFIKRESAKEFYQKISSRLSDLEFKVIVMYLDGMSVSEMVDILQKEHKTVYNALARAKAKLIKLYMT